MTMKQSLIIIAVSAVLLCAGCHSAKTTEGTAVNDTSAALIEQEVQSKRDHHANTTDTVHVTDSVIIVLGDDKRVISREHYRDTYRSKARIDTLIISDTTTVKVIYTRTIERTITVKDKLSKFDKFRIDSWYYLFAVLVALALLLAWQNRSRFNAAIRWLKKFA